MVANVRGHKNKHVLFVLGIADRWSLNAMQKLGGVTIKWTELVLKQSRFYSAFLFSFQVEVRVQLFVTKESQ